MRYLKRITVFILTLALALSLLCTMVLAKTSPSGQTVGTVLFYVRNSVGEDILASHVTVAKMEADMKAGKIDMANHNYSLLDRYVTPVHQEAQGFTVPEFVTYAQSKSAAAGIKNLSLTFAGKDKISFWEIDQRGFDNLDTYTSDDLYGVARYNFPMLYQYWNYRTQDYYDPAGKLTRDEVVDHIFENGEPETMLLSVHAFSQRYMITDGKYNAGDYNMENLWHDSGVMDAQRTIRVMKPMTEAELRNKASTAADTRYWVANILLDMEKKPPIASLGKVAVPTATMTEDAENYYIRFDCVTSGATILYNHNYISPSYTPSCEYAGGAVKIPKNWFPDGTVTMTCRVVKDGYTDAGVITLTLKSSGTEHQNRFTDVPESAWYYTCVTELAASGVINGMTPTTFVPDGTVTWGQALKLMMLVAGYDEQPATVSHWAGGYLDRAVRDGLTDYSGNLDSAISRLDFCHVMTKALKAETTLTDSPFSDTSDPSVLALYEKGVINGMGDGAFGVNGTLRRSEISKIIWCVGKLS